MSDFVSTHVLLLLLFSVAVFNSRSQFRFQYCLFFTSLFVQHCWKSTRGRPDAAYKTLPGVNNARMMNKEQMPGA